MFKLKCATGSWRFFKKKNLRQVSITNKRAAYCVFPSDFILLSESPHPTRLVLIQKDELEPLLPSGSQHLISELFQSPGLPTPLYRHLRVSCQSPVSSTAADFKTFRMSLVFVPCSPRILRISVYCRTLHKAIKVHIVTLRLRCRGLLSIGICAYKTQMLFLWFIFVWLTLWK